MSLSKEELARYNALKISVSMLQSGNTSENIIDRAKKFSDFILATDKPEVDAPAPKRRRRRTK